MKDTYHRLYVWFGILLFRLTGKTPANAYQSMISLFCSSGGVTNRILARQLALPALHFPQRGILAPPHIRCTGVVAELENRGYVIFPGLIPPDICDTITEHMLRCTGRYAGDNLDASALSATRYDRQRPLATKFDIASYELLECEHIQRFVCDHSLLSIAQAYLGSGPVIDIVTAWWSACTSSGPDSAAAQLFHFDMDRPRWLKVFLYLTDVTPTSGPHVFIPGSQRDGGIPSDLLRRGYARLKDEEVEQHFPRSMWIEATGSKGTVILEDTRGLHKGKEVQSGDRLVLQVEYASSLFGATRPVIEYTPNQAMPLERNISAFPSVFQAFSRRSTS